MSRISPLFPIKAARTLSKWKVINILLFCDTGLCLNLVSETKAKRDGVKITYKVPEQFTVKDVQYKPVPLVGTCV